MNIIQKNQEKQEIYTQFLLAYGDEHKDKVEIIKGKLYYATKDKKEIKWLQEMEIEPNPYDIVDGELLSSDGNLLLVDEETGSLTIPGSVTKIGEGAFANVEGLKTIIIPGTCKEIGKNAFNGNKTLENVIMQDGVEKIGISAFKNCTKLKNVQMTDSVTTMESEAFMADINLEKITLSNSITKICTTTFYSNQNLKQIKLPEKLETIDSYAFEWCISLESISLPTTLEKIGMGAFKSCQKLQNFDIPEENKNFVFKDGILFNKEKTKMIYISSKAINGSTFVVPNNVTALESGGILYYPQITRVEIPASVIDINVNFFGENVSQIVVDNKNENYCSTDKAIYNKNKTTLILYFAKDENVILEEGLTEIREGVFSLNKTIKNVILPNSLKAIRNNAFSGCNSLTNLKLGANVQTIEPLAFYNLNNLRLEIDSSNNYYTLENDVLFNKDKTTIITIMGNPENFIIPEGVTIIGNMAFHNKNKLKNIIIPNTVTEIEGSFNFCSSLTSIEIPSSVTSIGSECFNNASNLKSIIIHNKKGAIPGSPWGCIYGEKAISYQP